MIYRNKRELFNTLIKPSDVVLDVGFFGQGVQETNPNWGHRLLRERAKEVFGVDLQPYRPAESERVTFYHQESAENFSFEEKFDVIYAGDLIEHLSNPGLFLATCKKHLGPDGKLVITTPNCFNLFNLAGKLTRDEPVVNHDHVCYFNKKTIRVLLEKNDFQLDSIDCLYTLGIEYQESWKKIALNWLYALFARFTPKYIEDLVIIATTRSH